MCFRLAGNTRKTDKLRRVLISMHQHLKVTRINIMCVENVQLVALFSLTWQGVSKMNRCGPCNVRIQRLQ